MSNLSMMFCEMQAQLAPTVEPDFFGFPVSEKAKPERQPIDKIGISGISGISGCEIEEPVSKSLKTPPASAGAREGMGARGYANIKPESPETPEKPTRRATYISGLSLSNPEKERETGNSRLLRVLPALADDPDRQLAYDERAAFLEYECGLNRDEAEAQAAAEILPAIAIPVAQVGGPLLQSWREGLTRLSPDAAPCPDYRGEEWPRVLANASVFLNAFGSQAESLGWQTHELFGVHPQAGTVRPDYCGALVLGLGGPVRLVTPNEIRFGHLTHRKLPGKSRGTPIWEFGQ